MYIHTRGMVLNQVHFGYCHCNSCLLPAAICSQEPAVLSRAADSSEPSTGPLQPSPGGHRRGAVSDEDDSCHLRRARLRGRREGSYCGYPQTDGGEDHVSSTPMTSPPEVAKRAVHCIGKLTIRNMSMEKLFDVRRCRQLINHFLHTQ